MDPPTVEENIRRLLAIAPHSFAELIHGLPKTRPLNIRLVLNALRREGLVVQLEGRDDDGAPVYCLTDYVEASELRDHSDLRLSRNYGDHYSSPGWTADC